MKEDRICLVCGTTFQARTSPSRAGRGLYCSLACRGGNNKISHGHTIGGGYSPTYTTWINMVRRCTDPGHDKFVRYGAIGITVAAEWMDFSAFLRDMGERPVGTTIDRIHGSRGYEPGNCRWADLKTQQRNIKSNVFIEHNGQRKCVSEWAESLGMDSTLLAWRIRQGWSAERALTTPVAKRRPRKSPAPLPA